MDETTTTVPAGEPTGASNAQPVTPTKEAAVTNDQVPAGESQETTNTAATEEPHDDNSTWLQQKGIDLSTQEGQAKLAKSYRELERSFHEKSQKASDLEKNLVNGMEQRYAANYDLNDPTVQLAAQVEALTLKDQVRDWFNANDDAKPYREKMAEIAKERPYLQDLEAIYALAKMSDPNREQSLKSEGSREALETLATKQRAAAPTGAAVNPMSQKPAITRAVIAERTQAGDIAWLNANQADINQMVADGTLK